MAPSRTYRNVAVNTHRLERDMNSHRHVRTPPTGVIPPPMTVKTCLR